MKEITSASHPLVKHLVKLREDPTYRYEQGFVCVEGIKLVNEICQVCTVKVLMVSSESLVPPEADSSVVFIVSEAIMKKISGMVSPEGIVAEVSMPKKASLAGLNHVIAFDGVSDPGNMGALLRTALALGWDGAFILSDSCDPFNEKVIRSGRGAQFRLPLAQGSAEDLKQLVQENGWQPLVADIRGCAPEAVELAPRRLLVLGNEARGPSTAVRTFSQPVTIPMPGEMESLNVAIAGSILMYLFRK
jgi:RNA methyltransferase, TrmH family